MFESESLLLSCLQLFCDPVDCSPPGSSVCGISHARILEWVAVSFSKVSSCPRNQTQLSCLAGDSLSLSHQGSPLSTFYVCGVLYVICLHRSPLGMYTTHVWVWELDYKESWMPKNWCFWTVVLEKTLQSPLDCMEIQPIHPKGNQSWIFFGKTDTEAETPILWPPDENWLIGKDPDARKNWRQEEKGMTEDEMVSWHHWHNEHEFE